MNTLLARLIRANRTVKRSVMVGADMMMMALVLWAAFALRYGNGINPALRYYWWLLLVLPVVSVPAFMLSGLYRSTVRHMGPTAVKATIHSVTLSTLIFALIVALGRLDAVPRTAVTIYWLLGLLTIGGSRFLVRAWFQSMLKQQAQREPVVIYGAGVAGIQLATSLLATREYEPVAFVDDDPTLQKTDINGVPVKSPADLERLVTGRGVRHVLLAMPSVSRRRRRQIVDQLERFPVHIRTIPAMPDIVSGTARLDDIREVDIEDLLGRDPVAPDAHLLDRCVKDQVVLVTGAGGSIGSELCRQILARGPKRLILFEQSEFALYDVDNELRALAEAAGHGTEIIALLGSVIHERRLGNVMRAFGVATVYHAAAYKHVPIVEQNVLEGVQNNIFGTARAAMAARDAGVRWFVLVSTDKAVRPTNVMGASKRFAELVLQALADEPGETCFSMVRFGNVLGSSGSVVPLFRDQIRHGGPVTVTHPDVTRYFMTIPEAASLVIQAGSMAAGGEVFVLDMGESVRILDLARKMVHLSGYEVRNDENPEGDIDIVFSGLRPGEKLYEELLLGEAVGGTAHPMIMRASEHYRPWREVQALLVSLNAACHAYDCESARSILKSCVDGYTAKEEPEDLLWNTGYRASTVAGSALEGEQPTRH